MEVATMTKQLPPVTDPSFRSALKAARETMRFSYRELARRAGIHAVMPSRYENADSADATLPSYATWEKLNAALFPPDAEAAKSTTSPDEMLLKDASVEEIVAELKRRGIASVNIIW
ncbi:helix-turn-helix transcriptional regulator [Paraburkholderia fungorum]|uniref:helix-turn-helix domain-containing protein n=1 Tax=Paraburkholderia fungorum TaxID=134537 RepID=UPI0038BDD79F